MNELEKLLQNFPHRIILGSASPRRQELLKSLGFDFDCRPLNVDEAEWPTTLKAEEICLFLAEKKAAAYEKLLNAGEILITADTIVWCENKVYNKPSNYGEGKMMLEALSGRMHQVYTAVCLKSSSKQVLFYDEAKVHFKKLSLDEIDYYLKHFSPFDKAGGYGVQDWIGYVAIEKIEGSFYNVMGLPVKRLFEEFIKF
jgi:septum formation protein